MEDYRLYLVGPDGHIANRIGMQCLDDADAIRTAQNRTPHRPIELWQGSRKVQDFPPSSSCPSPTGS